MINWPLDRLPKKNAFVVVSTDFGSMIVNRFDFNYSSQGNPYGVGFNLLETSSFDPTEINQLLLLLTILRELRGDGIFMVDGGANIGVHSLSAGRLMQGWGSVLSFEAQERVFYALAGNVAINNLFNVSVRWNALAETPGTINIPAPNYLKPASFGSLELQYTERSENIGQQIDTNVLVPVQAVSIDSLALPRLDFFKLDVEGMEDQVLRGATDTIARCKPVMTVERIKCDETKLQSLVKAFGYITYNLGMNILCIHEEDPIKKRIT